MYGGALLNTWFDRNLSLAGRVACKLKDGTHQIKTIDFGRPVLYIPSLAIHLNREANKNNELNVQNHLSPILAQSTSDESLQIETIIIDQLQKQYENIQVTEINGYDLFCYDPTPANYFGMKEEFLSVPRLDNLLSCFVGMKSMEASSEKINSLLICCNHEEVGSRSNSGALGNFPLSTMARLFKNDQERAICLNNSFMISLDNAHATHPNYKDKHDTDHPVNLNGGPVIKYNAKQRYSSSGITSSLIRGLCNEIDIPCQDFVMRSDMACGSTIGPLISSNLGIFASDIGIPTWGMHSLREVTGAEDPYHLYRLTNAFFAAEKLQPFRS